MLFTVSGCLSPREDFLISNTTFEFKSLAGFAIVAEQVAKLLLNLPMKDGLPKISFLISMASRILRPCSCLPSSDIADPD